MVENIDRLAVRAAIAKLLSGTDNSWADSAQMVLNGALFIESTAESDLLVDIDQNNIATIPRSAVFGTYALVDYRATESIAIMELDKLNDPIRREEYRIFYGEAYEPLAMVRLTLVPQSEETMSRRRRLRAWAQSKIEKLLQMLYPDSQRILTSYWEVSEAVVMYSNVPEWRAGDSVPIP